MRFGRVRERLSIYGVSRSPAVLHARSQISRLIVAYDWSPDGKQLALTRNASSRDVVLISNFH